MKAYFKSFSTAFSMFAAFPTVKGKWDDEGKRYLLACLPWVGCMIAVFLLAWNYLCRILSLPREIYAAGMTVLPVLLSGGIHMDGFLDTVDAKASHASPEKKREILKDSRAGAFGVIFTVAYFLSYFVLAYSMPRRALVAVIFGLHGVLARALGGIASVCLPKASDEGLLSDFQTAAGKRSRILLFGWLISAGGLLIFLRPVSGTLTVGLGCLCFCGVAQMAKKEFGGMSGDIAGYLIVLSQLWMMIALVVGERLMFLWC